MLYVFWNVWRFYLDEISDPGQQVVESDLGLLQVGLRGAEGDALPAPGAQCRVGDGGRRADAAHYTIPHLAAAPHVHWGTPAQGHATVCAFILPGERNRGRWRSCRGSWEGENGRTFGMIALF